MRVLMFGWEFPPHISGGLGTACFGLTQSLVRENINVIFVVPRLHGNEPANKFKLVNASDVTLPISHAQKKLKGQSDYNSPLQPYFQTINKKRHPRSAGAKLSYVESAVALDPYSMANSGAGETSYSVENWNYVFDSPAKSTSVSRTRPKNQTLPKGYQYQFSGSYGTRLMEEVEQYALVGAEIAKQYPHDVIHAHDWMTFAAGIGARRVSGKPLIIHVHATEFDRSGNLSGPVFDWEKRGMEESDRIIAVSQWTKDILISKYGVSPEKVEVVHNGIIASDEAVRDAAAPVGSHVVTFLGRVTHQKGPRYFVEAARKVALEFPDAHFIVAGSGDLLPQTIERVAQLRLSDKFHFTGFLNKEWINRVWAMSNVYVMPSVSEPFGITPLEAIQAGVPVILSNQSGVAEVMPHALKVNFWDTDALAESICSVLKYKSLSGMLKTRGEKEIKELSWSKAAVKLKNVYEELTPSLC
jgi:glycogen synthase